MLRPTRTRAMAKTRIKLLGVIYLQHFLIALKLLFRISIGFASGLIFRGSAI